ncbi:NAD(P)/FAD-dependent oxidoreductase [Delftia acidovorans]|uniref:FAD-dependent oxidoreductase n=1 Tax=Delftia acidovorans TaxID=80866 RepID=A0AAJ2QX50_DELAC|nr:FAD-dependent oxidoreductase [Delftia acidovorans]MDX4953614.1 FAD-dependent oxidoreductase [Delftia acidovorans]
MNDLTETAETQVPEDVSGQLAKDRNHQRSCCLSGSHFNNASNKGHSMQDEKTHRTEDPSLSIPRRRVIQVAAVGMLGMALQSRMAFAASTPTTKARIVVVGSGAGGLAVASRLAAGLAGAEIIVIDARKEHHYQPGLPLVGAGLKPIGYVLSQTAAYIPMNVRLVPASVTEFDADGNAVVTDNGGRVPYDFLVVATGLSQDYAWIEGMDEALIGKAGIGSVYRGPAAAQDTWKLVSAFSEKGGHAVFIRPASDIKCPTAPMKYTFLVEDHLRRAGIRSKARISYNSAHDSVIGMPALAAQINELFEGRDIAVNNNRTLRSVDPGRRIAVFNTKDGTEEVGYDFLHVVPPMRAPDAVRKSPLPWQSGNWAAGGWLEVSKDTLRHARYPNVYGLGDVVGAPVPKTAFAAGLQSAVVADQIIADIAGRSSASVFTLPASSGGPVTPEYLGKNWAKEIEAFKPAYLRMLSGSA